jgi:hypothetical protein
MSGSKSFSRLNSHSRAEFQLSHECVWRIIRLFVVAMGKNRKLQIGGTDIFSAGNAVEITMP